MARSAAARPSLPLGSLTQRDARTATSCLGCSSPRVTSLSMNLTDGTPSTSPPAACAATRRWSHDGVELTVTRRDRAHPQGQLTRPGPRRPRLGSGTATSPRGSAHLDPGARMPSLSSIVKAYDVRGVVPDQLDARVARALGAAFAQVVADDPSGTVVVGHDMRDSSPGPGRRLRRRAALAAAGTSSWSVWSRPTPSTTPRARWTAPARCSPRATTPRSTTGSSSAGPGRARSGRTPGWPTSAGSPSSCWTRRQPATQRRPAGPADRLAGAPGRAGRLRHAPALRWST